MLCYVIDRNVAHSNALLEEKLLEFALPPTTFNNLFMKQTQILILFG